MSLGTETLNASAVTSNALNVDAEHAGLRLDAYVAAHAPDWVSRSRIKELVKAEQVSLNGAVCTAPNQRLKQGDVVHWMVPEPEDPTPQGEDIPLVIAFEDDHLIVVDKPAGLVVHPAAGNWNGTLVNALIHHCGASLSGVGGVKRPGIVHRLDKETSGLIVVAKHDQAHQGLAAQFADHGKTGAMQRRYQALVWGETPPFGRAETWLGRDPKNRQRRAVVPEGAPDARHAVTHWKTLDVLSGDDGRTRSPIAISHIECTLETGRTHQIRVHMTHEGHPLIGDPLYGRGLATQSERLPDPAAKTVKSFRRQALHAAVLGFEHPVTKEPVLLESGLPKDMARLKAALETITPA
ncbi:MAG: RluA family pseudouridine synthase [Pseudomonadota bacterium]